MKTQCWAPERGGKPYDTPLGLDDIVREVESHGIKEQTLTIERKPCIQCNESITHDVLDHTCGSTPTATCVLWDDELPPHTDQNVMI